MCKMGKQVLIYPNDRIIYGNREIDTDRFIKLLNMCVNFGCVITFYEALSGFAISNQRNDEFYLLKFSEIDIENYKNGVYTRLTSELNKLLLLQEQKELSVKTKRKK